MKNKLRTFFAKIWKPLIFTPLLALIMMLGIFSIHNYSQLTIRKPAIHNCPSPVIDLTALETRLLASLRSSIAQTTSNQYSLLTREAASHILNTTVRIKSGNSSGSGVVIYSHRNSDEKDSTYRVIVLTNHHVVDNNIVTVEKFNYMRNQRIGSTTSYEGHVILRETSLDLALVELETPDEIGPVARFVRTDLEDDVSLYDPIYVSGCPLGNPPRITNGNVSFINARSCRVSAFAIFGNSGGGVFNNKGKLVALVSRITKYFIPQRGQHLQIPEPNITHTVPGFVIRSWLMIGKFNFILQ